MCLWFLDVGHGNPIRTILDVEGQQFWVRGSSDIAEQPAILSLLAELEASASFESRQRHRL